jgi:Na+/H+ antiporter NhaD/arsenite permease-like protein
MRSVVKLLSFLLTVLLLFVISEVMFSNIKMPDNELYRNLDYLKFNAPKWVLFEKISFTIFMATVVGTIFFWRARVAIAAAGIGLLLLAGVMDIETTIKFMSIPTILFIISMLAIIGWLEKNDVFEYWIVKAIKLTKGNPDYLFFVLMLFSVILGGFAGEVTSIMVSFTLALTLCKQMKVSPLPYLMSLVFATNIGSALTLVGNPIGIYIAFSSGLGFEDFLLNATWISFIVFIVSAFLLYVIFREHIKPKEKIDLNSLDEKKLISDNKSFLLANLTFVFIIVVLFIHKRIEALFGLVDNTALLAIPIIGVGVAIFAEGEEGKKLIEEKVDWWSILFFMFLFAKAACLEYTGITPKVAYSVFKFLESVSHNSNSNITTALAVGIILFGSGILSGFVDNLPIIAALVPVVKNLIALHLPHADVLWWALLFGGCFGGNLTMIGSTANLIAVGLYEKDTGHTVNFFMWMKIGAVITFITLALALLLLVLRL